MNQNFSKIKDATSDIILEYKIYFFGCSGRRCLRGKGYFKSPDKIKAVVDNITYFARKNNIRKIDEKGKRFYVKLKDALDFSVGFNPKLITHNFNLKVFKETKDRIVLEGIPKPGILKNVKKVFFYIDPQEYLLHELDVKFANERLGGKIKIEYQKIKGLWVPVSFAGESALVIRDGFLAGMGIKLSGENVKINTGLPDKLFNPGF